MRKAASGSGATPTNGTIPHSWRKNASSARTSQRCILPMATISCFSSRLPTDASATGKGPFCDVHLRLSHTARQYSTATCSLFSSFPANWSKTKSIAKAALGTGIAAVASEGNVHSCRSCAFLTMVADLKDVKLYFQTEDKSIQEWKGDGSGNW